MKIHTKPAGKFCGEFCDKNGDCVGQVVKLANGRFAVRGVEDYSGRVLWQSAEFSGREFKKIRTLNLGYASVNYYTAK